MFVVAAAFAMLLYSAASAMAAPATCAVVEIAEVAAPGSADARELMSMDGTAIAVSRHALVSTADIAAARPALAEGHDVLEIDLSPSSAATLRAFSAAHVGTRLAFVVNGQVRNVARILDPIMGQGLIIDPVSPAEAAALAGCLHGGVH
jgi:preprotein translocase subunit SecD